MEPEQGLRFFAREIVFANGEDVGGIDLASSGDGWIEMGAHDEGRPLLD
jgi:hypothetical protein